MGIHAVEVAGPITPDLRVAAMSWPGGEVAREAWDTRYELLPDKIDKAREATRIGGGAVTSALLETELQRS